MSIEAISRPRLTYVPASHAYEVVETIQSIATTLRLMTTTSVAQVALVAVTFEFEHDTKGSANRSAHVKQSTLYYLEHARTLVRKSDIVFWHKQTLYFLLLGAALQGAEIVQTRLWDALLWRIHNTSDIELLRPKKMTIGHSAYPQPYDDEMQCILAAHQEYHLFEVQTERTGRKASVRTQKQQGESGRERDNSDLPTLARKLGVPYLSLLPRKSVAQVQQLVNLKLVQELHCYPLGRERGTLTVAIANPQDRNALDRLHKETGLHIFPVLAHPQELQTALDQLI